MKTPGEWASVYGIAMAPAQFAALVRAIQADALEAAASLCEQRRTAIGPGDLFLPSALRLMKPKGAP